jgi:hypothetical protein
MKESYVIKKIKEFEKKGFIIDGAMVVFIVKEGTGGTIISETPRATLHLLEEARFQLRRRFWHRELDIKNDLENQNKSKDKNEANNMFG